MEYGFPFLASVLPANFGPVFYSKQQLLTNIGHCLAPDFSLCSPVGATKLVCVGRPSRHPLRHTGAVLCRARSYAAQSSPCALSAGPATQDDGAAKLGTGRLWQ